MDFLMGRHGNRRFSAELLRIKMQGLAVQHFDGSFVAHKILAVTVMIVAEVAAIVDVKSVRIFVDGAERIGATENSGERPNRAGTPDPGIYSNRCSAGWRRRELCSAKPDYPRANCDTSTRAH